jgi:hypothetical protein
MGTSAFPFSILHFPLSPLRFTMHDRAIRLAELSTRTFDVLVIGGGITGAGIARDAAMRGLSVALIDKGDFASGTSSRSSRLIHGGVRYLEHGHLHLVFERSDAASSGSGRNSCIRSRSHGRCTEDSACRSGSSPPA